MRYTTALYQGLLISVGEMVDFAANLQQIYVFIALMVGHAITATIFGSMAELVKNIDKGKELYSEKMDFINEHMR